MMPAVCFCGVHHAHCHSQHWRHHQLRGCAPGADAGGRVCRRLPAPAGAVAGHAACWLAAGFSGGFALSGLGQRHAGQHQSATHGLAAHGALGACPLHRVRRLCGVARHRQHGAQRRSLVFFAEWLCRRWPAERGAVAAGAADWLATAFVCAKRRWPDAERAERRAGQSGWRAARLPARRVRGGGVFSAGAVARQSGAENRRAGVCRLCRAQ